MNAVIDLAGVRWRRQHQGPFGDCCDGSATDSELLRIALEVAYARLLPTGAPTAMPDDLRRWLRCWAHAQAWDDARLQAFVEDHARGVAATFDGVRHDPAAQRLLAPELLLVLLALDTDPHSLRACWPQRHDVREVLALADLFGRPYSS